MLNVVDEFTMVKKLQNHILVLEKSIDKLITYQTSVDYQIKKLDNINIASIVTKVLKELNTPEDKPLETFEDLMTYNAKITTKNMIKRRQR
ncbi:hypothetical protein [Pedobacter sp. UC225_65]|uniref:hypothetical protein n=1 Tax=Pedobacter sp. UC225_65 TaxID=3350173 RepID=UPI003670B192